MSQSEIELLSSGGPALLDGGFARTGKPASVFPPAPGAEAERGDFTSDAEPVSLHDLGVVLGRAPAPPAWSGGSPRADAAPREAPERGAASPIGGRRGDKDPKPSFFQVDPVPAPDEVPCELEEPRAPDSGHEDLRRLIAPRVDGPARLRNSDIFGLRGALFADAPKPPLVPLDLSALVAEDGPVPPAPGVERPRSAPKPPPPPDAGGADAVPVEAVPRAPTLPVDLVEFAPPPEEPLAERSHQGVARSLSSQAGSHAHPGPRGAAEPSYAPAARQGSGAPGPVVAERRAAAARRSGIASWAVVVSVSAAIAAAIVVVLRVGVDAPRDARSLEAPTAPALAPSPPVTTAQPEAAHAPADPQPPDSEGQQDRDRDERDPSAPPAAQPVTMGGDLAYPTARPIEPTRMVTARQPAAAAPPPAPPPSTARPAASPPPDLAPPRVVAAPAAAGADFDQAAARVALAMAASQASICKQPDDPGGGGRVSVTFSPSGRAMSAQVVGAPFQGTRTGACIARTFRGVTVPPFSGDPVTVTKSVSVR